MLSLGSILLGIGACCIVSVRAAAEDRSSDDPILGEQKEHTCRLTTFATIDRTDRYCVATSAYKPNVVAAIAFCAAYLAAAAMLYRNAISRRDWWSLCMPIGATCERPLSQSGPGPFLIHKPLLTAVCLSSPRPRVHHSRTTSLVTFLSGALHRHGSFHRPLASMLPRIQLHPIRPTCSYHL